MIQDHVDAVLALPKPAALVVLDGEVPKGQLPPYVLLYFADGNPRLPSAQPLTGASIRYLLRIYAHCVGGDQKASRAVSQMARTWLLDVIPTMVGRTCFPIRAEDGQPTQRDETTGVVVQDKVDVYRLESIPG